MDPALCQLSTLATFLTLILAKERLLEGGQAALSVACFFKTLLRTSVRLSTCSQPLKLKLSSEVSGVSGPPAFHFLQTGAFTLQGGVQARMCASGTELRTGASLY